MKEGKKYESSALGAFVGFCGVIIIVLILVLISLIPGCKEFNKEVSEGIKNDPRPTNHLYNYMHPNMWANDTITEQWEECMDKGGVEKGINKDYPNEWVMGVTKNGDTIWE